MKKVGFKPTHGVDGSEGMLKKIPEGLYQNTLKHLVGIDTLPEDFKDKFDIVISCGCMGPTHFPPMAFEEALSCLKKGGFLAFDIRASYYDEETTYGPFRNKTEALEKEGKCKIVNTHEVDKGFSKGSDVSKLATPQKGYIVIL